MYSVPDDSAEHLAPNPNNVEYDTLNSKRMLGGKQLVTSGEVSPFLFSLLPLTFCWQWRKKLHLDANKATEKPAITSPHIIIEKEIDEKASLASIEVPIGKLPEPTTVALPSRRRGFFKTAGAFLIPLVAVTMHAANLVYLVLRAYYIIKAQRELKAAFTSAWLFWATEVIYGSKLGKLASVEGEVV